MKNSIHIKTNTHSDALAPHSPNAPVHPPGGDRLSEPTLLSGSFVMALFSRPRYLLFSGLIVGLHLLSVCTSDIQEDAYITFRTAFNLADHGELSFNLQEGYSGATSVLYSLLVFILRKAMGNHAISALLTINALATITGAWLAARVLHDAFAMGRVASGFTIFFVLSILPVSLLLSARGMETPHVILLFMFGIYGAYFKKGKAFEIVPILLLPLVRIDAIAYAILCSALALSLRPKHSKAIALAFIGALVLTATANQIIYDTFLPHTVSAKIQASASQTGLPSLAQNMSRLFTTTLFYPVNTRFFAPIWLLFSALAICVFAGVCHRYRQSTSPTQRRTILCLSIATIAIPMAYAFTGAFFEWYFWPSQFLFQSLFFVVAYYFVAHIAAAMRFGSRALKAILFTGLFTYLTATVILQLTLSYSHGVQESEYRASVGRFIHSVAHPDDTLFLEPAGYIPFFAQLKTIDEVGLASPVVLKYKKRYPKRWWIALLQNEKPTFLVQRAHILEHTTYQGYSMTAAEAQWFDRTYQLVRTFQYRPQQYASHAALLPILKLGSHASYYVFRLKKGEAEVAPRLPNRKPQRAITEFKQ
ncbi:MAG: hypothetical protein JXX14_12155 [Deltaproteobacteria bacterium]|nr:hypothetical protein [Deltaproteobacteria bacterium]